MSRASFPSIHRILGVAAFVLFALPAAKNDGCGPSVPIGGDTLNKPCGTAGGVECASDQYCHTDGCNVAGVCAIVPDACPAIVEETICGCDGNEYAGACQANMNGINADYVGVCQASGECGGPNDIACGAGEFCKRPTDSCNSNVFGECVQLVDGCIEIYAPVCGCNGETYSNGCYAELAGQNIVAVGACPLGEGELCGTLGVGAPCADGLFCNFTGDCGASDGGGFCTAPPENCDTAVDVVCGCDNVEYSNACVAQMSSMSVKSQGACPQ